MGRRSFKRKKPIKSKLKMKPMISVIILTFHREQGALSAVRSVFAQKNAPSFEIILMDNDGAGSGKDAGEILAKEAEAHGIGFRYGIEPAAGVANARNSALKLAVGDYIAFLDDDEVAFENWLEELFTAHKQTKAEVVFGPIEARLGAGAAEPKEYFKEFFSRLLEGETRIVTKAYGCGNCLIEKAKVLKGEKPFNPDTNETGGEDDLLFAEVSANGGQFAWAHDAWVYEDVPDNRANWNYLSRRSFAFGHNTTSIFFDAKEPNYVGGVIMMARGALQTLVMGFACLGLFAIGHPKRAWAYDKMLRGLGKVLWFGPFKMRFYGLSSAEGKKAKAQNTIANAL